MAAAPPPNPAPVQPPPGPLQVAQNNLREFQLFNQDKFHRIRHGIHGFLMTLQGIKNERNNGRPARWQAMMSRTVPKANYQGNFGNLMRLNLQGRANQLQARLGNPPPQAVNLPANANAVGRAKFSQATGLMTVENHFTYIKILGAGGNGMAVLWRWTPGGDPQAPGQDVVLKVTTAGTPAAPDDVTVEWEKQIMTVSDAPA